MNYTYPTPRYTTYKALQNGLKNALMAGFLLAPGTGGDVSAQNIQRLKTPLERTASPFELYSAITNSKQVPVQAEASVKEKLEFIEETFELRLTRVANLLGVTRQAIYDWKHGKNITDGHRGKLDLLYRAVQRFAEAGLKLDYNTKHRNIGGDLEFIQALEAGQDPVQAVEKLIVVIERGKKQQATLEKLLKDRPEPRGSVLDELPPHYPGE